MSEEIALAAADLETVRQLRAALDVALAENDAHRVYERSLESRMDEWQATASQALRAVVLTEDAVRKVMSEHVTMQAERNEARGMLIAMYEGGEALPSSIYWRVEAWRDAHPRVGRCPMCQTVHKPDPYADMFEKEA